MIILALFIVAVYILYKLITKNNGKWEGTRIPFMKPQLLVGSFGPLVFQKKSFIDFMVDSYKYFKIQGARAGGFFEFTKPVLLVLDPELHKLMLVKDFDAFTDRRNLSNIDDLFVKSLVNLQGEKWRAMRNILSPAFTSSKMKNMLTFINNCSQQMVDYVNKLHDQNADEVVSLEMKGFFTRYANDVIASSAFGFEVDSFSDPNNQFYLYGQELTDIDVINSIKLLLAPSLPKFCKLKIVRQEVMNYFHNIIHDTIREREEKNIVRPDMIHLLAQARKGLLIDEDNSNLNMGKLLDLTDEDISAQAVIFFFGGFDTSSTFLSFVAYALALDEDIQERLFEEIERVISDDGGKLTYDGVMNKMTYLDMVCSETSRRWGFTEVIDRVATKRYIIPAKDDQPEIVIEKGDTVYFPIIGLHLDHEYFPNPLKFDPERFSPENKHKLTPFSFSPFGHGPRACIGMRFALMEAKACLVHLVRNFKLVVTRKTDIPLQFKKGSLMPTTENGIWIGFKPRSV